VKRNGSIGNKLDRRGDECGLKKNIAVCSRKKRDEREEEEKVKR
jgi:hypothetical protein